MGRKDWQDKDTKVRGKGKVAKRQPDLKMKSGSGKKPNLKSRGLKFFFLNIKLL